MDVIDRMLEHDRWATGRLLEISRDLTDKHLDREFDIGLRTLRGTFDHLAFNIEFWTRLAKGQPTDEFDRDARSITVLSERHERVFDDFAAFARKIRNDSDLDGTFVDHWGERPTYGGMIVHVIQHNAEHRSEIIHMLHRIDAPGVPGEIEVDHALWDLTERNA